MLNNNMLSVSGLVKRYPQGLGSDLGWGGKCYYKINCSEPYNLNSTSSGFILRDDGRVQCYSSEDPPSTALLMDTEERGESLVWWDEKLDSFYPHPFFSDKKIVSFECIRTCPSFSEGVSYKVLYLENRIKLLSGKESPLFFLKKYLFSKAIIPSDDDGIISPDPAYMLKYPEFFKPVYE